MYQEDSNAQKNPPKRTRKPRGKAPSLLGGTVHGGQAWIAEVFARENQGNLIYVSDMKDDGWYRWTDHYWQKVPTGTVCHMVVKLIRRMLVEAIESDRGDRAEVLKTLHGCETKSAVEGIAKLAAFWDGIPVPLEDLDANPDLIGFTNGTYELVTDTFRAGEPGDYITKVMGCEYDPHALCPNYDRMISEAQPDPEMRAYLHRMVGSALEGRVVEQMMPIFDGLGGNGKGSTLNDSWLPAFGDYGLAMPVEILLDGSKDYVSERLALKGARLVVTSEPKAGTKFNAALMKLLTGGDELSVRILYTMRNVSWRATHQIFLMCNFRPEAPADDRGVWRRVKPLSWNHVVPEGKEDGKLPQKLARELSGIVNRILEGWRDFRDGGLRVPEACREDAEAWRNRLDLVQQFIDDRLTPDPDGRIQASSMFTRWSSYCKEMAAEPGTVTAFSMRMQKKGYGSKKSNGRMFYRGFAFTEPTY